MFFSLEGRACVAREYSRQPRGGGEGGAGFSAAG